MKRFITSVLAIAVLVSASFAIFSSSPKVDQVSAGSPDNSTQQQEADVTETNQKRLLESTPPPELQQSLERENLKRRLEFMNDADRVGYIYLLANNGQVISQYTIKGKPSSLNSLLTTTDQIKCSYKSSCVSVASPDLDGSYGENPDGIFFFTSEGVYVEWAGQYLYSSERLNVQTPLSLVKVTR